MGTLRRFLKKRRDSTMVARAAVGVGALLVVLFMLVYIERAVEPEAPSEPSEPATTTAPLLIEEPAATYAHEVIGFSVEGRTIDAYTFGTGATRVLLVGAIHGGYEWNSALLAYEMLESFKDGRIAVPAELSVTIIPVLNPDGLASVVGTSSPFSIVDAPIDRDSAAEGRFNARRVDLNRNFGCKWQPEGTWRGATVSAGTHPFSEPESAALRDWVFAHRPVAALFWHSKAGAVYASECYAGVLPTTRALMNAYATGANYQAIEAFDAYPVTGDVEGWLASIGIAAITIELETGTSIEYERNKLGLEALLRAVPTTNVLP